MSQFIRALAIMFVLLGQSTYVYAQAHYTATAHCSITGANGKGSSSNSRQALSTAIGECILNGGVPQCCSNGSQLRVRYSATAYCSATGRSGQAYASRQDDADELAIYKCIGNGGIPHCCRSGLRH